jgi:phospholipid/cholesterol/gamma-HCH transport system substrate-binding protein
VVIAAYADDGLDDERSQILTQERANAVRAYLIRHFSIDSAGWFRGRKVAAVGFGTLPPELADAASTNGVTPRRVDVIVFTPQT